MQLEALATIASITAYLDGEKTLEQLKDNAKFVAGGLRDVLVSCAERPNMLTELFGTIIGPEKMMLALLLSLMERPPEGLSIKFNKVGIPTAKQRLLDFPA
jgi:hypothetical protein